MLFNSIDFAIFLPIVFLLYWFATGGILKLQNIVLLVASYFFYACWDWRFLFLLLFSTLLNYFTGILIHRDKNKSKKKLWFWIGICVNLIFLGIFKYYNFFAASFADGLSLLGINVNFKTLQLILPVGISFYTFIGLSYIIDIYKNKIAPERNFINYSILVSFFPLILAGPIERATHLLPQIRIKREFDYSRAVDGLRQILWGLFKKVVIADNCADWANLIFNNPANYSGIIHVLGALLFALQIYCDFSGYSDIALGTARLFGIDLLKNFAFPYFSRDIAEFWKRWHISLSSWFRDYLFLPIAFSISRHIKSDRFYLIKTDFVIYTVSIAITWILVGLWHGPNYTYIIWGAFHGLLLIINRIVQKSKRKLLKRIKLSNNNGVLIFIETLFTFFIIMLLWIFFRADNLQNAISYLQGIFSSLANKHSYKEAISMVIWKIGLLLPFFIILFLVIEWQGRKQQFAIARLGVKWYRTLRWAMYFGIVLTIFYYAGTKQQFIYFQF
jgi:alginate O-acetyltransferase complex protein AlgI